MEKRGKKSVSGFLYGLTFLTPVVYSVSLQEMDNLQKLIFSVLVLIVYLAVIHKVKSKEEVHLDKYLMLAIIIFPVTFLTVFLNSSYIRLPFLFSNLLIPLCIIIFTIIMFFIFGEQNFFKTISLSIVTISSLFAFIGLLEVFRINVIPLPTTIAPGSTIGHRSFAVEYLLPSLPFFMILKEYLKKERYPLLLVCAFVEVSFILFTRSRSAMVVLGIIIIIYFIYYVVKIRKPVRTLIPVAAVIAAAFIFSLLPAEGAQRTEMKEAAESIFNTEFRSNKLRLKYWDASLQMISENPLTGIGLNRWSGSCPKYFTNEFDDKTVKFVQSIHAHNDFLELFAESGFLASMMYLVILILVLKNLYLKSKRNSKYFYIFLTVLSTALFSFVAFPLYKFSSQFLMLIGIGISLRVEKESRPKSKAIDLVHLKKILLVLVMISIIISIIKIKSEVNFIKSVQLMRNGIFGLMMESLDGVSSVLYPFDPSKQPVDYYRGLGYTFLKNYPEALKYNLMAKEQSPYSPVILNNVAIAYHNIGNTAEAITRLEKLKELFPNYSDPQIKLLYIYASRNQEEKVRELLSELKIKFPGNPELEKIENLIFSKK